MIDLKNTHTSIALIKPNLQPEQTDAAEAARQFEALFVQQMMKSMREAGGESEFFNSSAMKTYTDMFDQKIATNVSEKGIGLAEQLLQQLQSGK